MFVPLHDGHQVKQDCDPAQDKTQGDIAFAAGAVCIVIPHDHSAKDKAGSPISFSTISDANSAVM
jgi:hypothetical protein